MPGSMLINKTDTVPILAVLYSGRGNWIIPIKAKPKNKHILESHKCHAKINQVIRKEPAKGYLSQVKKGLWQDMETI